MRLILPATMIRTQAVGLGGTRPPDAFPPACAKPIRPEAGFHRITRRVLLPALGSLLLALGSASATELTSLGDGLAYLNIRSLAESEKALRSAVPGAGALVLDLRQVTAKDDSLDALRAAVGSHPAGAPLYILVSPATPPAVAEVIKHSPPTAITLGVAGSAPGPRVVVKTDADSDRRAYEALAGGTPVETLISGKIEKERFDEATLVQEFKNGNPDAAPPRTALPGDRPGQTPAGQPAGTAQDPTAVKPADAPEAPARLVDRVLQRAVHLHHALLALRR